MRVLPGIAKLPEYLESISFRNPGDDPYDKTLFSYTNDTDLNFFQWLQQRPKQHAAFNASMAASVALERASSPHGFADLYPFERELGASVSSADEVVLVDVGGGYGHVLEDVKKHIPQLKGRMVLQDLPETIQSAKLADGVEAVAYDFFAEEQPVHGKMFASHCNRLVLTTAKVHMPTFSATYWMTGLMFKSSRSSQTSCLRCRAVAHGSCWRRSSCRPLARLYMPR